MGLGLLVRSLTGKKAAVRNRHISHDQTRIIYEWEQTEETITLYTKPPNGISKQNMDVTIKASHITIGRKGRPPFMKEELFGSIDPDASTWDITAEGELAVVMLKVEEGKWPCVMMAHLANGDQAVLLEREQRQKAELGPDEEVSY
jgi:hypothetical protein